jgi:hypothetical protein
MRNLAALHAGNDPLETDIGYAEHAPRNLTRHSILPFTVSAVALFAAVAVAYKAPGLFNKAPPPRSARSEG